MISYQSSDLRYSTLALLHQILFSVALKMRKLTPRRKD